MLVIWVLLITAALFFFAAFAVYRMAFYSAPSQRNKPFRLPAGEQYVPYAEQTQRMVETLERRPYETVHVMSHDGLRLVGQYYHVRDGAPLDIGIHGYRGSIARDFCGGSAMSIDAGHNLLLVEQRAQGRSEGKAMTFGVLERLDCLAWVRYAVERFGADVKITLYGISMGATTVLMTADAALPENVKGIIADCGYTSPKAIIARTVRQTIHMPAGVWLWGMDLWLKIFTGLKMADFSCAQALENTKLPVIMVHGKADDFVPHEMGVENYNAIPGDKLLLSVENATHGVSFLVEKERIWKELLAFFDRNDTKNTQAKGLRT